MTVVNLTADEVILAAQHGLLRRHQFLLGRRGSRAEKQRSDWNNEIEGACAELAVCKHRGVYWTGAGGLKARDGGSVDVRWTKLLGTGGLIVYEQDDDDVRLVLVEGFAPEYRIVGWRRAAEAKRPELLREFGYLVPRTELRRFE